MPTPKILIVEDEAPIADGLAYNLRREGMDVIIAPDGRRGLNLLNRQTRTSSYWI
jgi:DNA-binding response OmpR family regulator